jgi:hypothetical protein
MLVVLFYLLNLIYVEVCNSRSFEFIDGNIQLIWPFGPRCLEFDHIVNASFTVHELSLSPSGARAFFFSPLHCYYCQQDKNFSQPHNIPSLKP